MGFVSYDTADYFPVKKRFTGSTALVKGQGVCYDLDFTSATAGETATDPYQGRVHKVELPSTANNRRFAGVVAQDYAAVSGGQEIEIYLPGSVCEILVGVDTVLPTAAVSGTYLTCSATTADAGRFTLSGHAGCGTAEALETDASGVLFSSLDGAATSAWTTVSTITATGIGAASAAGNRLVVLAGADDAAGGAELATTGVYTIVSAPTADTITIATDIGDVDIVCYVLDTTEHTVLARLCTGPESGLHEWITPTSADAVASMVGGVTFVAGGYTMAADSTFTLADADEPSLRKSFVGMGTLTTQDYLITATSALQGDVATAAATIEIDAAGDWVELVWAGNHGTDTAGVWAVVGQAGVTFT